jgi:hypothetical protein
VPDAEAPPFRSSTVNVQSPPAKCTEPGESASQPFPVGAAGADAETGPLFAVFTGTPGANSTQPHVVAVQGAEKALAMRFCACGRIVALGGSAAVSR